MLDELTSAQLSEWEAYCRLEPFEEQRADYRNAQMCSIVVNIAISMWGKKGVKITTPSNFMPEWDYEEDIPMPEVPKQSVEEMADILRSIAGVGRGK